MDTANKTRYFYGVGRRKSSTARAKYFPTTEEVVIFVNNKEITSYFPDHYAKVVQQALQNLGIKQGSIKLYINGGGTSGQADAARLALVKALILFNAELKPVAKTFNYTTTDIRKVLPKRPGLRKARKREQWSKR